MLGNLGSGEILIVGTVLLLLFGSKKLNDLARGLGESSKELKKIKKEFDQGMADSTEYGEDEENLEE